ncbi:bifunctional metallophosphatase/5'-nucleotidase [Streptomyces sp. tea 10]|nr:bifunctional metallophosphatase/5'-nucleotidase [Streptomyces sp. tea 10]
MSTTLIATSDFHSSVPDGYRTLEALGRWRAAGALLIDAGDFFGGTAFHEYSQGRVEERILAGLYDAVVPGNHDLADLMRIREPELFPPVVCCNLTPPAAFTGRWEKGLLLPQRDMRVGVVGFIGSQAFGAVPVEERVGFTFTEPTPELLAAERARLLAQGADIVIGVSHSGFQHDVDFQRGGVSPFAVIVAGHCHSQTYHWASGDRHVAKGPELGAGLLRVDLRPDGDYAFTIEYHPPARSPLGHSAADLAEYQAWGAELLGTLAVEIPDRDTLADLVAGQARELTGADAFLLNLPTLRGGLPAEVTRQALADAAPFDVALVRLAGELDIGEIVQRAVNLGEEPVLASVLVGGSGTVATTAYLAGRLGLPAVPVEPHVTLRATITSLFGSHS